MSEAPRFIAIKRRDARSRMPRRGRRAHAAFTAELAASSAMLEDVGYELAHDVAALPDDPALGGAVPLPQTASLVVEPPVGTDADAVSELLGEEYIVVPDVELSVPEPTAEDRVPPGAVAPIEQVLPDEAGVTAAHAKGNRGKGAVVAVLDSGCTVGHDQFAGRAIDFAQAPSDGSAVKRAAGSDSGRFHGTHVSGIVSGATVGMAPDADLIVVSVIDPSLSTTATRVWRALEWLLALIEQPPYADRPVILNMSLGFPLDDIDREGYRAAVEAMRELLRTCIEDNDILPVVAIGNEGVDKVRAPGYFPEALAVGGVAYDLSEYANSGGGPGPPGFESDINPDIAGFGVRVLSSTNVDEAGTSHYEMKTGTSQAAPYVAGIAALVAAATGLEGAALRDRLLAAALPIALPRNRVGAGLTRYPVDLL